MKLKDTNLYYIGGVVRDEILGLPSFDIDYCYEGNAIEFAKTNNLNIIKENPDFGTIRIQTENDTIDIASTRCETYPHLAHLPVVNNIGCSLKEDLSRRDFTINAMAKNTLNNNIVDYFKGLEDLKNKKLIVLHNKSFIEDPSRIIRGLKFSVRFNFELEENTRKLQETYLKNVNYDQSYHRLKKELKETFNLNSEEAFNKFIEQQIYKLLKDSIEPPKQNENIENLVTTYRPKHTWLIYLGCFDLSNFELTTDESNIVECFNNIKNIIPKNNFETYKMFNKIPLESILLYCKFVNKEIGLNYLENLSKIKISVNGDDLIQLGLKQGEIFKEVFDFVLKYKIDNPHITKAEELNLIKEHYKC